MRSLIRKSWLRLTLVSIGLIAMTAVYPYLDGEVLREEMGSALRASTLLFAICTALSLAVLNNYIQGLKEAATNRIYAARTILEKIYDDFRESEDPDEQEILNNYVVPMLTFSTSQWHTYDPLKPVFERIVDPLTRLHERDSAIAPRYFLRLEDEINELGLLYVRRVISGLHSNTISGSFILVCLGIIAIFLFAVTPSSYLLNFVAVQIASAIVIFAVLEIFLLVSYILQESREELPDSVEDDNELEE